MTPVRAEAVKNTKTAAAEGKYIFQTHWTYKKLNKKLLKRVEKNLNSF